MTSGSNGNPFTEWTWIAARTALASNPAQDTTMTTKDLLRWKSVGQGIALAADWFKVGNDRLWIDFISSGEGIGQRGKWTVSAIHSPMNRTHNGKGTRVTLSLPDCSRDEAADKALAELVAILET
jgi:hypothetical protein